MLSRSQVVTIIATMAALAVASRVPAVSRIVLNQ